MQKEGEEYSSTSKELEWNAILWPSDASMDSRAEGEPTEYESSSSASSYSSSNDDESDESDGDDEDDEDDESSTDEPIYDPVIYGEAMKKRIEERAMEKRKQEEAISKSKEERAVKNKNSISKPIIDFDSCIKATNEMTDWVEQFSFLLQMSYLNMMQPVAAIDEICPFESRNYPGPGDGVQSGICNKLHAHAHGDICAVELREIFITCGIQDDFGKTNEIIHIQIDGYLFGVVFAPLKQDVCSNLNFTYKNKFALAKR